MVLMIFLIVLYMVVDTLMEIEKIKVELATQAAVSKAQLDLLGMTGAFKIRTISLGGLG